MKFFTGIITGVKDASKGFQMLKSLGRGVQEFENRPCLQIRGICSMPASGDPVLFLEDGNLVLGIPTDSGDRPVCADGETLLYASKRVYLKLKKTGTKADIVASEIDFKTSDNADVRSVAMGDATLKMFGHLWDALSAIGNIPGALTGSAVAGIAQPLKILSDAEKLRLESQMLKAEK